MRRVIFSLLAALISGNAPAEDLIEIYRDAVANDAQLAAARAQYVAAQERLPQGRAGLLPVIGVSGNTTWNDVDYKNINDRRSYNSNGYSLRLTQPLFNWQNWLTFDQAKLQVAQAEAQFASARQDLVLRASTAYFDVLLARFTLWVLDAQKIAVSEQLEAAKKNFEVGTATITDTHEAQSRYDLVIAQEIAAMSDLEVKRQALRQITGKEPGRLKSLRTDVELQRPEPEDIQKWVEAAEAGAYGVQIQQATLEIARREIERARAGHYPTVDVVATYGQNNSGSPFTVNAEIATGTIGLQFALPIYQGGAVSSRERETAALKDKAVSDLDFTRRSAALAARQAYVGVTSGLAQIAALRAALVSSQSSVDSNKLGYEVGVRINIDVLNAQQQLAITRRDLAKAFYDTLISQLRLKAAVGTLGEEDILIINALLE